MTSNTKQIRASSPDNAAKILVACFKSEQHNEISQGVHNPAKKKNLSLNFKTL